MNNIFLKFKSKFCCYNLYFHPDFHAEIEAVYIYLSEEMEAFFFEMS